MHCSCSNASAAAVAAARLARNSAETRTKSHKVSHVRPLCDGGGALGCCCCNLQVLAGLASIGEAPSAAEPVQYSRLSRVVVHAEHRSIPLIASTSIDYPHERHLPFYSSTNITNSSVDY